MISTPRARSPMNGNWWPYGTALIIPISWPTTLTTSMQPICSLGVKSLNYRCSLWARYRIGVPSSRFRWPPNSVA